MNVPIKHLADMDRRRTKQVGISAIPSLERSRIRLYLVLVIADIGGLLIGFSLASLAYNGGMVARGAMLEAQMMLPIYLTIALYNGTYSLPSLDDLRLACLRLATALFLSAALVNLIAFYLKANAQFSRVMFTLGLCFSVVILMAIRGFVRRCQKRWFGPTLQNILLIDAGGPTIALQDAYQINAVEHGLSASLADPHGLDRLGQAIRHMDRVVVSCSPPDRKDWGLVLRAAAVDGEVISHNAHDLVAIGVRRHEQPDGSGFSTLVVSTGPLSLQSRIIKRLFDIGFSIMALVLLFPVMLVAAIATLIEDGRPVLFRQRRLGKANRFFHIVKFRSMRSNDSDVDGTRSTARDDERLTKSGRFLRSWSIDELPQLWNVLKGEMSVVGPRPHALGSLAGDKLFWEVDSRYWQRHSLKPGMTGLAQIRGFRGATDQEGDLSARLKADLEYLDGWSIWRDIVIIFATLRVLAHDRAY